MGKAGLSSWQLGWHSRWECSHQSTMAKQWWAKLVPRWEGITFSCKTKATLRSAIFQSLEDQAVVYYMWLENIESFKFEEIMQKLQELYTSNHMRSQNQV